jgi:hypothetical protein
MVGYASQLGGETADFPSQVADLTMEAVDLWRVAASGEQTAIVTKDGEPAVVNSHGQAVPIAPPAGIAASIPTWGWLALAIGVGAYAYSQS